MQAGSSSPGYPPTLAAACPDVPIEKGIPLLRLLGYTGLN